MSAAEIARVYREAADVGVVINSIWGGEPLIREDLPEILRASHSAGLTTVLISSGFRFNERFDELVPWLDAVIFSLDHPSPRHDEMRGMPGLFEAITRAIDRLKRSSRGPRVMVNAVISRLNQDVILDLARWAADASVPIFFSPIEVGPLGPSGSALSKQSLAVDERTLAELFRRLITLKVRGYPIRNSYTYLRTFIHGKRPYHCHARKVCLELRPNGDLVDCLDRSHPVANAREVSLRELMSRPDIIRRRFASVECHVCNNANVIDTSYVWELRPESVLSLLSSYLLPM